MAQRSLWLIPLGGLGEFGMNMLVLRSGDDMILIDAGMMFPEAELLGVDIVIPDITYLKHNRDHVRAISALLDELEERRSRLYRLKAGGARRAGLRDLLDELEETEQKLRRSV